MPTRSPFQINGRGAAEAAPLPTSSSVSTYQRSFGYTGATGGAPVAASDTLPAPLSAVSSEYAVSPFPGARNGVSATTADAFPLYTDVNPSVCW